MTYSISGKIVDIRNRQIYAGKLLIDNGRIRSIEKFVGDVQVPNHFILPGFIDAHVHIESSMLVPSEFARLAVVHGTVATISDPHEIANVCGFKGVDYMIKNGSTVPFKFHFGAPSCVPATEYETAGSILDAHHVESLLQKTDIYYLSEMMNFPGVLHNDKEVILKIATAKKLNKPVDGHAPGLRGIDLSKYIGAGISTDHECFTKEEALDKLNLGMKILIREGSAAKNFDALIELMTEHYQMMMFCSDDKHPDSLVEGHINALCERAVKKGIDVFKVLQAACINPIDHYNMNVGKLQVDDPADFVVVEDLIHFKVLKTYINGELVAENGRTKIVAPPAKVINNFHCLPKRQEDIMFRVSRKYGEEEVDIIEALDGQLITNKRKGIVKIIDHALSSNVTEDLLKIVVVNRYKEAPVARGFIKNFKLKTGALASSVAHDSHNIIAVGVDDESICRAINMVISKRGGISLVTGTGNPEMKEMILPLPVAGLMSNEDGYKIAEKYTAIDLAAKGLGSKLSAPFMTLSFMALLVIPHLKLSDLGLFDGDNFQLIN